MKEILAGLFTLLGVCSALIENVHLMVNGPVEFGQLQPWLARFPSSQFYLYGEEESSRPILEAVELGYQVRQGSLMSECPGSNGLCALNKFGGLLASIDDDLEYLNGDITTGTSTVLWKERKKTSGPCSWCINGVFDVLPSPIISPPGSPVIEETIKLLKQKQELNRALMLSAKKHPQKANLLIKSKKSASKIKTRVVNYLPYLAKGASLVGAVSITTREKIPFVRLSVNEGNLSCGDKTGKTSESIFDTQAQYNAWIQSCQVNSEASKTRLTIDIGGLEQVDIWIYKVEELVTILVKTFGRMDKVRALVESALGLYPNIPIIVGDDGLDSQLLKEGPLRGFYYYPFEYDIGLSGGRNRLVEKVKTEYVLFLDDDFTLTESSDLTRLVHELNMNNHDLVAGKSPNCDMDYSGTMRIHKSKQGKKLLLLPQRSPITGSTCERVDIVPNLFMAETRLFRKIKWDSEFKLGEHEDFFLRAKRLGIRVGTCPGVAFDHHQTPVSLQTEHYREMRGRVWGFLKVFLKKHDLTELVAFGRSEVTLKPLAKIRSLAQVSAGPFSLSIRIVSTKPHPSYKVDLANQHGETLGTNVIMNPEGLLTFDFPQTGLDPDRSYKVTVRPGTEDQFADSGPALNVHTISFTQNNLIVNPSFDGSMLGWKKSLGAGSIGLMPLFFPQSEPDFTCKKDTGHFKEHIEGRTSEWAADQKSKNMDRNYAAFLMAPPVTSFSQIRPFFFIYQDVKIPPECIATECQLTAAAWARVDKIWGETESVRLVFSVEFLDKDGTVEESHEHSLDPFRNQDWQLAHLDREINVPASVERVRISLKVRCNVGAVFADDFFLSITPL